MLAMCINDGFTVGNRLYRKGEVFPLSDFIAQDVADLSDEKMARKQMNLYGEVYYRRATIEEMVAAYERDKAIASHMTSRERKQIAAFKFRAKRKEEDFMGHLDVDEGEIREMVEGKPEEKVVEAEEEVVVEQPEQEVVAEKKTTVKKTPAKKKSSGGKKTKKK
jgi:hypothetical protein